MYIDSNFWKSWNYCPMQPSFAIASVGALSKIYDKNL